MTWHAMVRCVALYCVILRCVVLRYVTLRVVAKPLRCVAWRTCASASSLSAARSLSLAIFAAVAAIAMAASAFCSARTTGLVLEVPPDLECGVWGVMELSGVDCKKAE